MTWKKILFFALFIALAVFLWNNGVFRSSLRALAGRAYPEETKRIKENTIEFNLSEKPPAFLSIGLYYPKDTYPEDFDADRDFGIDKDLNIKLFKNGKLVKSKTTNSIKKIYSDFRGSDYKVAVFYTFIWSPEIKIPGRQYEDNNKITVELDGQFRNLQLIMFDYAFKPR